MNKARTITTAALAAVAAALGLTTTAIADPTPTQTITAICDTGTVTIKNYPAGSKVIVRTKPNRGNYEPWNTRTVYPFQGDLTVVVKVPGTYAPYAPWVISVEFWPGNIYGQAFTWGQPFTRCI